MIMQILSAVLWLLVVPFASGLWLTGKLNTKFKVIPMVFLNGYLVQITIFQILYIVILKYNANFNLLVRVYEIVILLVAATSVFFGRKLWKEMQYPHISIWWLIPTALILFQMIMRIMQRVYDGDDAFFVASAVMMESSGVMGLQDPYTGLATAADTRHALAAAPAWIAFLGRASGIHVTVMAHIIWADVVLALVYINAIVIGSILLKDKSEYLPFYATIVALLNIFGNVSLYMPAIFLMTRTWQGKAMYAAWFLPLIFLLLLMLNMEKEKKVGLGVWLLSFCVMFGATFATSAGIFMSPILFGLGILLLAIVKKRPMWIAYAALCCLGNIALGALFLIQ